MDEAEQDQYEARLKELFDSFDATGTGSLDQEELTDLCHMLQLGEVAPSLQHALLQDNPLGRVHFDQFKEALILVLSNSLSNEDAFQEPVSSTEVQPKYIKDGKRYGRRSVPELQDSLEFDEETVIEPEDEGTRSSHVGSRNCEEMWKSEEGDEYEAEGQLRFWNPDDLSASQNVCTTDQEWLEQKLQLVCDDLGITRNDHLNGKKLISICEQYGLKNLDEETLEDMIQNLDQEETMSLQDFFYEVCKNSKPLTPSSSTPYRHLKRHLSMPSYDECGRRTITPSSMVGAVGFRLLSKLDDGTGYGSVEDVIDLWQEEGIENSQAILKALDFNLEGKINLVDLTMILENELLMTKNEVYQAALVSFRSEIRHLLERADQAAREKEKLRSDLEKNEKLKSQMASEVDDHHAEIERQNEYNLRKLDEEYKEKTATLKNELRNERDQILQQTTKQRLELEQELDKAKAEENYLRDRLNLCLKENCRLETELLQTSEKLVEYETLACKLQRSLDNIMREKFGDMDPTCMEFLSQEERLAQMRNEYELQRRELQDRIDELQLELEDYRTQGLRGSRRSLKNSLFDEMDNKNATETDQGIGPEDCPPLNMSIEAEMAIEQMREQHNREVEILTNELQCKTTHCEEQLKEMKSLFEKEKAILKEQFEEEIQKAEVQLQFLQMQHAELEADILKLKEEQYKTECEHQREISNREALFHEQKSLLEEKEAALQKQLTESKQTFLKEKEEFAQKAEKAEKKTETKLLALTGKFEEEKKQLEQSFQEQLDSLTVKQEVHLQNQLTQAKQTLLLEKEEFAQKVEKEANTKVVALTRMSEEEKKQLEQYFQEQIANLTVKQESVLQNQLAQAKHSLLLEKEEFAQKVEKETEARVAALTKKCEEQKIQLEQSFQEEIASITERQQSEKEDRTKVLETHHLELQKEREKMETEYNKRISDMEFEFSKDFEAAMKNHEEALAKLEDKYQNNLKDLTEKHTEEKSQWEFEKEELIQDNIEAQERLKERIEKGKLEACSALVQEREHMEKTYKAYTNNLVAEKQQVQKELENLLANSKKEESQLSAKISQLESDLREELTERDEQLCQAEKNALLLKETIEKLEREHNLEKEHLCSKLKKSEEQYKDHSEKAKQKREDMFVEISRLQSTISGLQNEISSLSILQGNYNLMKKENAELKNHITHLQSSACMEEDMVVLKNLQNVHEQTVKENVRLASELSRLRKKLDILQCKTGKNRFLEPQNGPQTEKKQLLGVTENEDSSTVEGDDNGHYMETLEDVNLRLQSKIKELKNTTEALAKMEKSYKNAKAEYGHLQNQMLQLQENMQQVTLENELMKKAVSSEEFTVPDLEQTPLTIPGLKLILAVAKKENLQLQEKLNYMELKNVEAVKNNSELSSEVLWLQKEIQNMEEIAEASLKLENMYEETKKENHKLMVLVADLEETVRDMEAKQCMRLQYVNKEIQTTDFTSETNRVEPHIKNTDECFQRNMKSLKTQDENDTKSIGSPKRPHNQGNGDENLVGKGRIEVLSPRNRTMQREPNVLESQLLDKHSEMQKRVEFLRSENKKLKEENVALKSEISTLEDEGELNNQKIKDVQDACEEMWVNLETVQNEKSALQKVAESLSKQLSEVKTRNQHLDSENAELSLKNAKNQADLQDLNRRLVAFLKQKDKKDLTKGLEEWQRDRSLINDELESYRAKVGDIEKELANLKRHNRFLEQENTLLKQEIETKQLSKCSEFTDLKNEISGLLNKNEMMLKEKEALGEELNRCAEKCAKVTHLESKIADLKHEQKSWEQQTHTLKSQLSLSLEKIQSLEESLQSVNLQISRIKSDLRVAQQEKESLKQEVMSLHKQLQTSNAKNQVLEMTLQSSGLQSQQKKMYWDDLEKLMEQEQKLLRQENERLLKEVQNAKSDLAQCREKVRQLESALISVKQQKHQNQSSMVKVLEQEKSSLKRECDHLQKELASANRKMLHSAPSATFSLSQQQNCATVPREQYLHLQQADRRSQQLQAAMEIRNSNTNSPQSAQDQLLKKMEARMMDVEEKLRFVKMLLQDKVNQLRDQHTKNTRADEVIKDLYVENAQLLKALEMSEQRHQTSEKKNYLLEEKISGLNKIVRDLAPPPLSTVHTPQRRC
ncbi:ninein isoform X2 [Xenopus laevis]|uniref:Ninein isoform X2 n=1 Tax=Xenopus laevis TaxID=8355 RepID=A0A8J1LJW3_XENLA|nr:ninein isoform X2 [Xenopus laevis]